MKSPVSTYRLQVHADFPFTAVRGLLDYLRDLGVGTLYFSPVFQARPRSPHGYDVTDPSRFSREVGDETQFAALSAAAAGAGMSIMLDIVPNHMAATEDNPWWRDLLEHGAASPSAHFFDVDWNAPGAHGRLVLPLLGTELDDILRQGELKLELHADELRLVYFARALPLDPATLPAVFDAARHHASGRAGEAALELAALARAIPHRDESSHEQRWTRKQAGDALKTALREKLDQVAGLRSAIQTALGEINRTAALRALIDLQPYQLAFWRTGIRRINYRRFFDIADLAGVRIEDRDVFEITHTLILELILGGLIEGIRIDHVDGLRDPYKYLARLRDAVGDTYVAVEKILAPGEDLRADWPVQGTTGYDYIGMTAGLYAHPDGLSLLTEDYVRRTRLPSFSDIVYEKKKLVIEALFAGELTGLVADVQRIALKLDGNLEPAVLACALREISASLAIYRTYIRDQVALEDRTAIKQALTAARHRTPNVPDTVFTVLRRILLLEDIPAELRTECLEFIIHWQQFTGPVTAKGLEDTAFYTYHRLISLCEVGARPDAITTSIAEFHNTARTRAEKWPFTMNASSTHDTKRSEDIRARLNVLTEMAPEWTAALDRWTAMNAPYKRTITGVRVPELNEEILLYQTLLGAWPLEDSERAGLSSRIQKFLLKAAREAKNHSSWLAPNEPYEQALFTFADAVINDTRFLDDFLPMQRELAYYGALNSLSQLVIKIGMPGVPDFYQGNELWTFALVDPDNRRPVDFALRRRALHEMMENASSTTTFARSLWETWTDGRIKLYVTWTGLQLRKQNPGLFLAGDYLPVTARGPLADHVIAFARRYEDRWVLFAGARFFRHLVQPGELPAGAMWNDTLFELPEGMPQSWQNILTNEPAEGYSLESFFGTLPFGIYVGR